MSKKFVIFLVILKAQKGRPNFGNTTTRDILWLLILEFTSNIKFTNKCSKLFQGSKTTLNCCCRVSWHTLYKINLWQKYLFRAPDGCLQYFTEETGSIESFNFDGSHLLENMDYKICIKNGKGKYRFVGMDRFQFLKNDRFVLKTTKKNKNRNDRFHKRQFRKNIVFFYKRSFSKTIVFKNNNFSFFKNDKIVFKNDSFSFYKNVRFWKRSFKLKNDCF